MEVQKVISLVLNAHLPFVHTGDDCLCPSVEEGWFFEALSETYLPLLRVFDRLEGDHIPFRLGISLSPLLCQMLGDEALLKKYLAHIDRQIEFGRLEMERTATQGGLAALAKMYFDRALETRIAFTGRYEMNILKAFGYYQRKGKIELLATSASHAFLPFLSPYPEAIQAQMEVAIASYRQCFGRHTQGFWLPELGWAGDIEKYLRHYNFGYTIVDTHGLVFGNPCPSRGSFYPVKTPQGIFILGRDFYAVRDIARAAGDGVYRENNRDAGYELLPGELGPFLSPNGMRMRTGFKYWRSMVHRGQNLIYDPAAASDKAKDQARAFLDSQSSRLGEAAKYMKESPLSLCAFDADSFGRYWYEGVQFLEALFRLSSGRREIRFMTPSEYLYKQDLAGFEISTPEFSSWGYNGYAETWLDASNDWMYRHLVRSIDRMTEMAERFPDDSGLKERSLNQAAREILLVQSSDWSRMLYNQDSTEYARNQIEGSLRNFTTIYEALGSNYISTEWL
ncbi:MAG: DUF1957 domain-containing protein, partial [Treponema sp.]|nr:DUF1957 domain-containing protein [Treponema sp.]